MLVQLPHEVLVHQSHEPRASVHLADGRTSCHKISWSLEAAWWSHQMETFSALLAICVGHSPVPGEFPAQKPVTRSFVFFYLRLNKRLIKQSWDWWFETLSRPLWRHRNGLTTNIHNVLLFVASLWLRHGSLWIQLAHLPLYFTLLYCDWAII